MRGFNWLRLLTLFSLTVLCFYTKSTVMAAVLLAAFPLVFSIIRAGYRRFAWIAIAVGVIIGIIFVFDITRSSTFRNIITWYKSAVRYGLSEVPKILVGNKSDLIEDRKIILPMAEHLSEKLNAPYFETSVRTGQNVKLIFKKIAELVYISKISDV